jgi:hypothetical protein
MTYSSPAIEEHRGTINAAEKEYFAKHCHELAAAARLIKPLHDRIEKFKEDDFTPSELFPRASLSLMASIFCALTSDTIAMTKQSVKLSRAQNMLLTMAGLPLREEPIRLKQTTVSVFTCQAAEDRFLETLDQVRGLRFASRALQPEIRVYHDANNKPLALQKQLTEQSALTLQPTETKGVILPPGTIIAIQGGKQTGQVVEDDYLLRTFEVSPGFGINPRRISAWAYDAPLDRSVFGVGGWCKVAAERGNQVAQVGLEDYVIAAQDIMERCGINLPEAATV